MKAIAQGIVIAEAPADLAVKIEGNWYFPPSTPIADLLHESATPYTCPWKGRARYFDLSVNGGRLQDAAWSYPVPLASAITRVGRDFGGFVAFDPRQVQIVA